MDPKEFLLPKYRGLAKEYQALTQCNRCGFCETVCPTYMATGKETLSPRGRNQAFRQILEGKLADPSQAADIFSTCLTCHACTNVCFSQVPVGKLMGRAREVADANQPLRGLMLPLARFLLTHRKALSALMWIGFLFKRIGVSGALRRSGILKRIAPPLDVADDLVEKAPARFGARAPAVSNDPSLPSAAFFSGCGIHYVYPDAAQAAVDVVAKKSRLQCPSHACCGLAAQSNGDVKGAQLMAVRNVKQFGALNVDAIVVDDDSCAGFLKNYGELLNGRPEAVEFAKKIRSVSEFLKEHPLPDSLKAAPLKVTFHDPCQMGNGHQSFSPPRQAIMRVPGVEFVELEESNWCCGGAGTYCLKHPGLAEDVLERKLDNIRKSGARVVLTEASSCLMHIEWGLRKKGWKDIRVQHIADFLRNMQSG